MGSCGRPWKGWTGKGVPAGNVRPTGDREMEGKTPLADGGVKPGSQISKGRKTRDNLLVDGGAMMLASTAARGEGIEGRDTRGVIGLTSLDQSKSYMDAAGVRIEEGIMDSAEVLMLLEL
ncbi:hypothetical protein Dimus_015101 [Dionaea muscipula]